MATTPIVNLDFDQIKEALINYIKADPAFSDYNFEGSALNAIADVLAYNTHTNAYYANMLHNEGFLDTAQKRSSVVSKAKELGYIPKSISGAQAYVNITIYNQPINGIVSLPRGTQFVSTNDYGSHKFVCAETYYSTTVSNTSVFNSVRLVEGKLVSNNYVITPITQFLTIPNKNVDVTTIKVYVRETINSQTREEFTLSTSPLDIGLVDKIYYLQESYDGLYQIFFGQNAIGYQPPTNSAVTIEYIVPSGNDKANGCRTFYSDSISDSILVNTTQVSFGGAGRENIDSIRHNSKLAYTSRNRAVTELDYEIVLKQKFDFIKSISVWGGEKNVPPVYGKVYVSIQPIAGYVISDQVKKDILMPEIKKYSVLTLIPEFVDPFYLDVEFVTTLKYNPDNTTLGKNEIISEAKIKVYDYVSNISVFNSDYINSDLISRLSSINSSIESVDITKKVGFKISPLINKNVKFLKNLDNPIVPGSIYSTKFNINVNGTVTIVHIKDIQSTKQLGLFDNDEALIDTIGTINYTTGAFDFTFTLYSYINSNKFIYIRCTPSSADIVCSDNKILTLQPDITDSSIGIVSNNVVNTIVYKK
jgi:hypothetical protein